MRLYLVILIFLGCSDLMAQSYTYSYIEPCSGKVKSISIPYGQNNVTVNYYGNVNTFNANDFNNGNFSLWMNSIAQMNSNQPCGEITTVLTNNINMVVTQNIVSTVMNVTSIASMAQSISSLSSNMGSGLGGNLGNSVNNSENSGNSNSGGKKDKNNGGNNNNNSTNSGSNNTTGNTQGSNGQVQGQGVSNPNGSGTSTNPAQGNQSSPTQGGTQPNTQGGQTQGSQESSATQSGTTSNGQPQQNGTGGSPNGNSQQGTGGSPNGNSGQSPNNSQESSENGKMGGSGGTANSISNAEDNSGGGNGGGKNGGSRTRTGSIIGTGDVVALRSAEDPSAKDQFKFTASLTRANTDNTRVKGFLGNFTTEINNTNLTLYSAWVLPKSQWTIIGANSTMLNFEKDIFNTTTLLASKRFKGTWKKLTAMGGLNYTIGRFGETKFSNISAVGGGFYSFNVGKKISGSILCLAVYSPFTQFYDGQWWQSSTLLVPFSSWDYSISKTFKFNVSFSGVYEVNKNFMNYQVLTGGKILF